MSRPSPTVRRGEPLFALRWFRLAPIRSRHRRGQSTVEYALVCAFMLVVIAATMLRFANLPSNIGDLLVHQLVFQLGLHWHGVLTYF